MPLRTSRLPRQGRPRPSLRRGGSGIKESRNSHWASVRSVPKKAYLKGVSPLGPQLNPATEPQAGRRLQAGITSASRRLLVAGQLCPCGASSDPIRCPRLLQSTRWRQDIKGIANAAALERPLVSHPLERISKLYDRLLNGVEWHTVILSGSYGS